MDQTIDEGEVLPQKRAVAYVVSQELIKVCFHTKGSLILLLEDSCRY